MTFHITPVEDRLLRGDNITPLGLYHLHLATCRQLTRLHYGTKVEKYVQKRLKSLTEGGFVQAAILPTIKPLSSPYYYRLTQKGMDYLSRAGLDTERVGTDRKGDYLFVTHTLELNDLLISAVLLKRLNPQCWLENIQHERTLKRTPYKAGHVSLIPDAFFSYCVRTGQGTFRLPLLLEHDRGTEEQQHFQRRIKAYSHFLAHEGYKAMFGVKTITIAFTTFEGQQRLEQMRRWTKAALGHEPLGHLFYFAALDRAVDPCRTWLEPCWYTVEGGPHVLLAM